jgi:hypothetical protein
MFRELVLCAIALPALAQVGTLGQAPMHVETRDFAPGGNVRIQFRAADPRIRFYEAGLEMPPTRDGRERRHLR